MHLLEVSTSEVNSLSLWIVFVPTNLLVLLAYVRANSFLKWVLPVL